MLATLVDEPFNDPEWIFETKWDGYRALAYVDKAVRLYSRNENLFNPLFPLIVEDLHKMNVQAILDGEVVILDEHGRSDFQLMQNYQNTREGNLYYYVFDLLYVNGEDLRHLPLIERKERLRALLANFEFSYVRFSDQIEEKGCELFRLAQKHHLEGIIAKHSQSTYQSARSKQWLKIKTQQRQEAIIGGFTEPQGGRKKFGALLLGVYDKNKVFQYIGHVGTGFDYKTLVSIYEQMKPLVQVKCPFSTKPKSRTKITWVKPKLVCEVSFSEWTQDNVMRHPVFEGIRTDKKPATVVKEDPMPQKEKSKKSNGGEVTISNPDKIYWPKEKYTKQDLVDYYNQVTPYILPYLKNRPMVLRRFPNGIEGESFVQKNTTALHLPDWMETVSIEHEDKDVVYFVIQNRKSIDYIVNLGSIEMHPFHARVDHLDYPDYFILDLDPESVPFDTVISTAQTIHQMFDSWDIPHYLKTSGGRGLHIYIPMGGKYTQEQVAQFGEVISLIIHQELPKITSLERKPVNRQHKIYLDVLQNRAMQTVVAPYSVRGKPHAPVSTPLHWEELVKGVKPEDFNMTNMMDRLQAIGDIFSPVLGRGFNILKWIKKRNI